MATSISRLPEVHSGGELGRYPIAAAELLRNFKQPIDRQVIDLVWGMCQRTREENVRVPSNVALVGQAAYGIISKKSAAATGINKLETGGLGSCVALILVDHNKHQILMAHVDKERVATMDQMFTGMEHVPKYTYAIVAYNEQGADSWTRQNVVAFALKHIRGGCSLKRIDSTIGITVDELVYEPRGLYAINTLLLADSKEEIARVLSGSPGLRRV